MVKTQNRMWSRKILIVSTVIVAIGILWAINQNRSSDNDFANSNGDTSGIEYSPPTEAEKKAANRHKEEIVDKENTRSDNGAPQGQKKQVIPVISSWGQNDRGGLEINGFIPEIIESGGTCTITLEKNGSTVTQAKTANADAQTTSCGLITTPISSLSRGTWTATLSYDSDTAGGSSEKVKIEVN